MKQTLKGFVLAIAALFVGGGISFAQVTTSALSGLVSDKDGEPVVGAVVIAVHTPSGTQYSSVVNAEGRYSISGMRAGGPYEVQFACLGYQSTVYTDVTLQLGDAASLNVVLNDDKEMLSEAVIVASSTSHFSAEKTGAVTNISTAQIEALPTVSRSIEDLSRLSPYGGNGMSFAGGDGRSSNFTVDGANFNNNFGLTDGLPGGGNPISLDAIDEVQIVISPYDVRQTNFIGGGMNAVTKSGTNTFKGSAYVYHRNENMRGNTVDGVELGDRNKDRTTTYGMTLGGPIIKNKLFFFVNFEYSLVPTEVNTWRASEDGVADTDRNISRTKLEDMALVSNILKERYGYDTGSYTSYPANESNMKALARIDWNINDDHHLALRYNYTLNRGWRMTSGSSSNCGQRATQYRFSQYSMAFANSLYSQDNLVHSVSVDLNSRLTDNLSNQFLATFSILDDMRGSNSEKFPFIDILEGYSVTDGTLTQSFLPYMSAGYELFTWNNGVHNRVVTVKDDITYNIGKHKIIAGVSYEYQMADNSYMRNGTGYYRYRSLEDFINEAVPETVAITYGYDGETSPAARVRFSQVGAYAQDEWTPNEKFKLTAGLRLDAIIFSNKDIMRNNAIYELDYGGRHIDTGAWPTTKLQISPRIGFSWDILGNKSLTLRGGTGLFAGRLPLVFFTNMPTNSGMVQNIVALTTYYTGGTPTSTNPLLSNFAGPMITDTNALVQKLHELDPDTYPLTISPEDGVISGDVCGIDPKFKMPQVWKSSIALDYNFPTSFPMSITGEFIYNKTIYGVTMENWNVKDYAGFAKYNGADNRPIYPSISDYTYTGTDAFVLTNTNKGYGYNASVTFNMRPIDRLNFMASYTHTVQKELTGLPGSNAESAFTYVPTVNGPNYIDLHNSQYVTPDRVVASLSYSDKCNNSVSLIYEAWRGGYNYSYMYADDLNGDNYTYDAMYIPRDETEIRFASEDDAARYWAYANNDKYLSKHKGEYAEAYSVYSPWVHRLDIRFSHDFKVKAGKSTNTLQLNVDFKNVLNIFNNSWGVSKIMNPDFNSGRILSVDRIDPDGVPVFSTINAVQPGVETWTYNHALGQCWYFQVGIKYMFN